MIELIKTIQANQEGACMIFLIVIFGGGALGEVTKSIIKAWRCK